MRGSRAPLAVENLVRPTLKADTQCASSLSDDNFILQDLTARMADAKHPPPDTRSDQDQKASAPNIVCLGDDSSTSTVRPTGKSPNCSFMSVERSNDHVRELEPG